MSVTNFSHASIANPAAGPSTNTNNSTTSSVGTTVPAGEPIIKIDPIIITPPEIDLNVLPSFTDSTSSTIVQSSFSPVQPAPAIPINITPPAENIYTPLPMQTAIMSNSSLNMIKPYTPPTVFTPLPPINSSNVNFLEQTTTILPLAEIYKLENDRNSPTKQLQNVDDYLLDKHNKEYRFLIEESLDLAKEKEKLLIRLRAQLELQLEAQKLATQQREQAMLDMQSQLAQEQEKAKKDAENMRLNIKSVIDLSPLVLNVNQATQTLTDNGAFDFNDLQNAQSGAESCKEARSEYDCLQFSSHCRWGKLPKKRKKKCYFMCENLSSNNCQKVSKCIFKDNNCINK